MIILVLFVLYKYVCELAAQLESLRCEMSAGGAVRI